MAIEIQDSTFGLLTQYQNCDWEFEYSSEFLGQSLTITIEGSEAEAGELPDQNVYESYMWFHKNQSQIKNNAEKRIFEKYRETYHEFKQAWGSEAEQHVPNITLASDIWNIIEKPNVSFYCDYCDFGIHWQTSWDPEHGVTLFFKNGEIIGVE